MALICFTQAIPPTPNTSHHCCWHDRPKTKPPWLGFGFSAPNPLPRFLFTNAHQQWQQEPQQEPQISSRSCSAAATVAAAMPPLLIPFLFILLSYLVLDIYLNL